MALAEATGIQIFATGGLGGVHKGGEISMDISADLIELGRTSVTVISSGCKSFLDIPRTLEVLETQGVTVATFADGRGGEVDLPAFWTRASGIHSPLTIQNDKEAAAMICEYRGKRANAFPCLASPFQVQCLYTYRSFFVLPDLDIGVFLRSMRVLRLMMGIYRRQRANECQTLDIFCKPNPYRAFYCERYHGCYYC